MELKQDERIDDLNCKGYRIIQHAKKFCFGMDAVLLANYAKAKPGERVLDLGTGTGIIPILMAAKTEAEHFSALEIQEESAEMAGRSVELNHLQERISVVNGDIKEASAIFGKGVFDVVTTNPPYMNDKHGLKNPDLPMAIARHEVLCSLEDVIREGASVLKQNGRFYMVHRPFRLAEIFGMLAKYKLEPKRMRLVHPYVDKEPNMVLIEALKGGKPMIKIDKPLIVYQDVNVYHPEIHEIYVLGNCL